MADGSPLRVKGHEFADRVPALISLEDPLFLYMQIIFLGRGLY
jgi:hypothetical protein